LTNFTPLVTRYAGISYIERLQSLPDWSQLAADALGIRDAVEAADGSFEVTPSDLVTEASPDRVAGSNLVRSRPASAAERRAQRRGAERRVDPEPDAEPDAA